MPFTQRLRFEGPLKVILWTSGIIMVLFGWGFGLVGLFDDSITTVPRGLVFVLLAIGMGTVLAWWVLSLSVAVNVDSERLTVGLWPLSKTDVDLRDVRDVETVTVDPLREYGGWGIKGSSSDRLYGTAGIEAVRVTYDAKGETQRVTILTDDTDGLESAVRAGTSP